MSDEFAALTNDSYFADEYLGYSIGAGIFWILGTITPMICMEAWLKPASFYKTEVGIDVNIAWNYVTMSISNNTYATVLGLTQWTKIAWMAMAYGSTSIYGLLTIFWLLAYIKEPWA